MRQLPKLTAFRACADPTRTVLWPLGARHPQPGHCGCSPPGWRPDLVLQMPRKLISPTAAAGLAASDALACPERQRCLKHYFLAGYSVAGQKHLQYLVSSGRLAFGSTPIPDIHTMIHMRTTNQLPRAPTPARIGAYLAGRGCGQNRKLREAPMLARSSSQAHRPAHERQRACTAETVSREKTKSGIMHSVSSLRLDGLPSRKNSNS